MKKKILIIVLPGKLEQAGRGIRIIKALKDKYEVTTCGLGHSKLEGIANHININELKIDSVYKLTFFKAYTLKMPYFKEIIRRALQAFRLLFGFFKSYTNNLIRFQEMQQKLENKNFDYVFSTGCLRELPSVFNIKKDARIIFDADYYFPAMLLTLKDKLFYKRYFAYVCKEYMPKLDAMSVETPIAKQTYSKNFHIKTSIKIVSGAPFYKDIKIRELNKKDKIKLVHSGGATRHRKIENMIDIAQYLDNRFEIHFVLFEDDTGYKDELKQRAKKYKNIYFQDPVPNVEDAANHRAQFDIGLILLDDICRHWHFCTPNKFFEAIQARLALAIGPYTQMSAIVKEYDLGVISDNLSPKNLADKLNALSFKDVNRYKKNSDIAAKKFNAENDAKVIQKLVEEA